MIQNGFDARMVCPNGVVNECWAFAARADMGEVDRAEITRPEAEALALMYPPACFLEAQSRNPAPTDRLRKHTAGGELCASNETLLMRAG